MSYSLEGSDFKKAFTWGCGLYLGWTVASVITVLVLAGMILSCFGGIIYLGLREHPPRTVVASRPPRSPETTEQPSPHPPPPTLATKGDPLAPRPSTRTAPRDPVPPPPSPPPPSEAEKAKQAEEKAKREAEEKAADEAARREKEENAAQGLLKAGKNFQKQGDSDLAASTYQRLIKRYPNTKAAEEARKLLKALGK
jgi:outer membrane biosynthesis protein TonB